MAMRPALGRPLLAEDHGEGGRRVVVLNHGTWRARFGGDADVIGRVIRLNDGQYEIVGVLAPGSVESSMRYSPGAVKVNSQGSIAPSARLWSMPSPSTVMW